MGLVFHGDLQWAKYRTIYTRLEEAHRDDHVPCLLKFEPLFFYENSDLPCKPFGQPTKSLRSKSSIMNIIHDYRVALHILSGHI